jgi:hypothetical protein
LVRTRERISFLSLFPVAAAVTSHGTAAVGPDRAARTVTFTSNSGKLIALVKSSGLILRKYASGEKPLRVLVVYSFLRARLSRRRHGHGHGVQSPRLLLGFRAPAGPVGARARAAAGIAAEWLSRFTETWQHRWYRQVPTGLWLRRTWNLSEVVIHIDELLCLNFERVL